MKFSDEQIIEIISDYIFDERNKQAILIDGEWGCGKTYFVKKKLSPVLKENEKKYKVIYTSLYGLETCKEIKENIYDILTKDIIKNKILKNKVKDESIEKGLNVVSKFISVALNKFEIDKDNLPNIEEFINFENLIVIFDDLERCNIEINKVLGFINDLVEHDNIRVIIVSNQAEIGKINLSKELPQKYSVVLDSNYVENDSSYKSKSNKKDDVKKLNRHELMEHTEKLFSSDILYEKIKEKLIGITITYKNNIYEIYPLILDEYIRNEKVKEYLLKNKDIILESDEVKKSHNLRSIIFAIMAFEKIYLAIFELGIEKKYFDKEINKILKYCIKEAILIKLGEPAYDWSDKKLKYGVIYDNKFASKIYGYGYKFIDDYLIHRYLDKDEIRRIFNEIVELNNQIDKETYNKATLSYYKLKEWWYFEDSYLKILLGNLLDELKSKKYESNFFKHIIVVLIQMKEAGFKCIKYEDYLKEMKEFLQEKREISKINLQILTNDKEFEKEYNIVIEPLLELVKNNKEDNYENINKFFEPNMECGENFYKFCFEKKENFCSSKKFIYFIDIIKFIEKIKTLKNEDIYYIVQGISTVYDFSNLNDYFKADIDNLKELIKHLNELIFTLKKDDVITKRIAMERIKNELEKFLDIIKK